jgi:hypothetical protein
MPEAAECTECDKLQNRMLRALYRGRVRPAAQVRGEALRDGGTELRQWAEQAHDQTETGAWLHDTYQRAANRLDEMADEAIRAMAEPGGEGE